jgi:sugar phosphate isomerase/epimerase
MLTRRKFLKNSAAITGGVSIVGLSSATISGYSSSKDPLFKISLAEWSLNKSIFGKSRQLGWEEFAKLLTDDPDALLQGDIKHLDFAKVARQDFGIGAVEYVNTFFFNKATNKNYLKEMKTIANGEGVKSLLIMCDREGALGDPDDAARTTAVENHYKWIDAANYLGCHSIRVNAQSEGEYDEQIKLATDGLSQLTEYGTKYDINVIVENHGGLSSNGKWLSGVINMVNHPRCGTLPDFGNFYLGTWEDKGNDWYDRYVGVEELMPYAKAVSAKSHNFNEDGDEKDTDYSKMMRIVLDAGYRGYVGIEYEGSDLSEMDGIAATKKLLEKVRDELAYKYN